MTPAAIFQFKGTLDRRQFLLTSITIFVATLGLGLVATLIAYVIVRGIALGLHLEASAVASLYRGGALTVVAVLAIPMSWATLAAYVKRARSAGAYPYVIAVGLISIGLIDHYFLKSWSVLVFIGHFKTCPLVEDV